MSIGHEGVNRNNTMPINKPEELRADPTSVVDTAGSQVISKQGLKILDYVVPWWIVVVIVLLVIYLVYDQGWLDGLTGKSNSQGNVVGLPEGALPPAQTGGLNSNILDTPAQMRELFGKRNW